MEEMSREAQLQALGEAVELANQISRILAGRNIVTSFLASLLVSTGLIGEILELDPPDKPRKSIHVLRKHLTKFILAIVPEGAKLRQEYAPSEERKSPPEKPVVM